MKTKAVFPLFLATLGLVPPGEGQHRPVSQPVIRRALLTATLAAAKSVSRVEIKSITLGPGVKAGLHLHPCPVVGVVTAGTVVIQIEGLPGQYLRAGDAFYEPANVRVVHFDNAANDGPATFIACHLLGAGDHELIEMLKEP